MNVNQHIRQYALRFDSRLQEMPLILKFIFYFGCLGLLMAICACFPIGNYDIGGNSVSYAEFWRSAWAIQFVAIGALTFASSLGILLKKNWGRVLFLCVLTVSFAACAVVDRDLGLSLSSLAIILLTAWYLYGKRSVRLYFRKDTTMRSSIKTAISLRNVIILLLLAPVFWGFCILATWQFSAPFFGIYPPVPPRVSGFPGFVIRIFVDGNEVSPDDNATIFNIRRSLMTGDAPSNYFELVNAKFGKHASLDNPEYMVVYTKLYDSILVTRSTGGQYMVQIDPRDVPQAKEFLNILENEMRAFWSNVTEASILTHEGMKPFRITVLSSVNDPRSK